MDICGICENRKSQKCYNGYREDGCTVRDFAETVARILLDEDAPVILGNQAKDVVCPGEDECALREIEPTCAGCLHEK